MFPFTSNAGIKYNSHNSAITLHFVVFHRNIKEVYYHLCYVQYPKLDMSIINEGNKYCFQYLCEPAKNISEC